MITGPVQRVPCQYLDLVKSISDIPIGSSLDDSSFTGCRDQTDLDIDLSLVIGITTSLLVLEEDVEEDNSGNISSLKSTLLEVIFFFVLSLE
jgi:hypothetical protein